jgi:hypothetical protein
MLLEKIKSEKIKTIWESEAEPKRRVELYSILGASGTAEGDWLIKCFDDTINTEKSCISIKFQQLKGEPDVEGESFKTSGITKVIEAFKTNYKDMAPEEFSEYGENMYIEIALSDRVTFVVKSDDPSDTKKMYYVYTDEQRFRLADGKTAYGDVYNNEYNLYLNPPLENSPVKLGEWFISGNDRNKEADMLQEFSVCIENIATDVIKGYGEDTILRFPIKIENPKDNREALLFKYWDKEQLTKLRATLVKQLLEEPQNTSKFCKKENTELIITAPGKWYLKKYNFEEGTIVERCMNGNKKVEQILQPADIVLVE